MYQALYRKYRPNNFDDVYGQDHITTTLKNQLSSGRIFHAYLFTGSRGTGKTTCAKILAKAACCENLHDGNPCNECIICKGIDEGNLMDVIEIDAASNSGVDDMRDLREKVSYLPAVAKYRVYIIDEVHMLSQSAMGALLKTLEEPPSHVIFILATTEVHKILATILSRCQRFDFKRISPELITKRIKYVCDKENIKIDDDAATLIASLADGGLRDALSILDLCAGKAGMEGENTINEAVVAEICGMAGREYLFKLAAHINSGDIKSALMLIGEMHENSVDMLRLCEELSAHLRNLLLIKTLKNPSGFVVCSAKEMEEYINSAQNWKLETIIFALNLLEDTLAKMARGNKRTGLEMAIIKLCSPRLDASNDALLARIASLEHAVKKGVSVPASAPTITNEPTAPKSPISMPPLEDKEPEVTKPEPIVQEPALIDAPQETTLQDPPPWEPIAPQQEPVAPSPEPDEPTDEPIPQSEPASAQGSFEKWDDIVAEVAKICPLMAGVLTNSTAYEDGTLLRIDCKSSQFKALINNENPVYKESIRNAALEVTGKQYRLGPYIPSSETRSDPLDDILKKAEQLGL